MEGKRKNLIALLILLITIWSTFGVQASMKISHNEKIKIVDDDFTGGFNYWRWVYNFQDPFGGVDLCVLASGILIFLWYWVSFYDIQ